MPRCWACRRKTGLNSRPGRCSARLLEPTVSPREREIAQIASSGFDAYFRKIIAARRAEPRDDILSALVQAEDEGNRLTERETLNMLRLLLIAGNETTTNLAGNGMLALLRNRDQLRRLREDPGLIPSAVEDLFRDAAGAFPGDRPARRTAPVRRT